MGSGKTTLVSNYVDNVSRQYTISTIGMDLRFKFIWIDGQKIKLDIWDTAG